MYTQRMNSMAVISSMCVPRHWWLQLAYAACHNSLAAAYQMGCMGCYWSSWAVLFFFSQAAGQHLPAHPRVHWVYPCPQLQHCLLEPLVVLQAPLQHQYHLYPRPPRQTWLLGFSLSRWASISLRKAEQLHKSRERSGVPPFTPHKQMAYGFSLAANSQWPTSSFPEPFQFRKGMPVHSRGLSQAPQAASVDTVIGADAPGQAYSLKKCIGRSSSMHFDCCAASQQQLVHAADH